MARMARAGGDTRIGDQYGLVGCVPRVEGDRDVVDVMKYTSCEESA